MRVLGLLVLAGCGGGHHTSNTMLAPNVALETIGAPHVAVLVANRSGLHRVWLDTGKIDLVDGSPDAIAITDTTYLSIDRGTFVIHRGREHLVVEGVTPGKDVVVSNDGKQLAIEQAGPAIAVITVADASVQRISVPPSSSEFSPGLSITWAKDGASLLVIDYGERYRVDLATAARTPIDKLDWEANESPKPTDCPARGLRLERRLRKSRQEIVLVPLASTANPEQLASTTDRVLVASTNYSDPWGGDGAVNMMKKRPAALGVDMFTPSCEHFVFSLEDRVYVGSVATGQYAFLMRGGAVPVPAAQ